MKKLIAAILSVLLILSFCGCCLLYDYELYAVDSFGVGYSVALKDAFIGRYNWDGSEEGMNVSIPEYYNKIKIKGLGGYFGRGVPTSFCIIPTEEARNILCPNATGWSYVNHTANLVDSTVEYLRFTVNVSQYIEEIELLGIGGIMVAEYVEDEETKYNVYVLTCYVTCDEENKVFYAKDGKLYFRKNDVLVEDVAYHDFDLEAHNEERKDAVSWWSPFA